MVDIKKIPLVPMAVALIAGIATGHCTAVTSGQWIVLMALSAVTVGLLLVFGKGKRKSLITTTLAVLFFTIGGLRCQWDDPRHDGTHWTQTATLSNEHPSYLILRLNETPVPRERSWRALAKVESVDQRPCWGDLRLYLRKDSTAASLRYGDRLLVHGYADRGRGTLYVTGDHYLVVSRDNTSIRARCEALRMRLLRRMQAGPLDPRWRGVAEALTLGWRGDLEPDLQTQFRDAGIMHLLCVSGLHAGLLAALVGGALFWLGKERRGRILRGSLQLLVLWGYVALTGLAPATTRAALMFSLFIVSHMMGRRTDTMNLLAIAALAMLSVNPMLLFNVGWQLSFCAVTGILLLRPLIRLRRNILWQSAVVSFAATLATLPVSLSTFHQLQPYFLIANIVIIPLAGLLLTLSIVYLMIPCTATAWIAKGPLWFCDWLTGRISQLPGAVVTITEPKPWVITLLAVAIVIISVSINIIVSHYQNTKNDWPS